MSRTKHNLKLATDNLSTSEIESLPHQRIYAFEAEVQLAPSTSQLTVMISYSITTLSSLSSLFGGPVVVVVGLLLFLMMKIFLYYGTWYFSELKLRQQHT